MNAKQLFQLLFENKLDAVAPSELLLKGGGVNETQFEGFIKYLNDASR